MHVSNENQINLIQFCVFLGLTALLATACCLFKKGGNHSRRRTRSQHHRSRSRSRDAHLMLVDNMESPPFTDLTEPPPPYTP